MPDRVLPPRLDCAPRIPRPLRTHPSTSVSEGPADPGVVRLQRRQVLEQPRHGSPPSPGPLPDFDTLDYGVRSTAATSRRCHRVPGVRDPDPRRRLAVDSRTPGRALSGRVPRRTGAELAPI